MNGLAIVLIIILGLTLEFLINHRFTNNKVEATADFGCTVITIFILGIGYKHDEWLFAILTTSCIAIKKIRDINLGKE